MVRRQGHDYVCSICGETLDGVSQAQHVQTQINTRSGMPRVRKLLVDNKEIHSCEMPSPN
jgi:hypothetical protein